MFAAKLSNLYTEQVLQTGKVVISSLPRELMDSAIGGIDKLPQSEIVDGCISLAKLVTIVDGKYDIFLTHEWGDKKPPFLNHIGS